MLAASSGWVGCGFLDFDLFDDVAERPLQDASLHFFQIGRVVLGPLFPRKQTWKSTGYDVRLQPGVDIRASVIKAY